MGRSRLTAASTEANPTTEIKSDRRAFQRPHASVVRRMHAVFRLLNIRSIFMSPVGTAVAVNESLHLLARINAFTST